MSFSTECIHAGYKLKLREMSEEDQKELAKYRHYTVTKRKKEVTGKVTLKEEPFVAMRHISYREKKRAEVWYKSRLDKSKVAIIRYIHTDYSKETIMAEGHIDGEHVIILLSKYNTDRPIVLRRRAISGDMDRHELEAPMKIPCEAYMESDRYIP